MAISNGDLPFRFSAPKSAPRFSRILTTARLPNIQAKCSGESPSGSLKLISRAAVSSSPVAASDDGSLAAQLRAMQLELARLAEAIPKDGGGGAAVSSAADGADPSAEARAALVAEVTAEVTSRVKA